MTIDPPGAGPLARGIAAALLVIAAVAPAHAAEPAYPFEGTWVRANRVCVANAPRVRTYTAHEVNFPTGRCTFRKVAEESGQFELFEDCRRAERSGHYTETIRMLSSDLLVMHRKAGRLKVARPLRFTRCTIAAPGTPAPHHPAAAESKDGDPKLAEPKAAAAPPSEAKP